MRNRRSELREFNIQASLTGAINGLSFANSIYVVSDLREFNIQASLTGAIDGCTLEKHSSQIQQARIA
jgi:hypothetical protein